MLAHRIMPKLEYVEGVDLIHNLDDCLSLEEAKSLDEAFARSPNGKTGTVTALRRVSLLSSASLGLSGSVLNFPAERRGDLDRRAAAARELRLRQMYGWLC